MWFLKSKKQKIQILTERIYVNNVHVECLFLIINKVSPVPEWVIMDLAKISRQLAKDEQLKLKLTGMDFTCK